MDGVEEEKERGWRERKRERERERKRNSEERTGMATGSHCLRGFYHTNDDALLPRHYYF